MVGVAVKTDVEATGFVVSSWLQADGGDYNPVVVDDGVVQVRLKGACASGFTSQRPLLFGGATPCSTKCPTYTSWRRCRRHINSTTGTEVNRKL